MQLDLTGLILGAAALVTAGLAMHSLAKTKQISQSMLVTYEKMLSDVREQQERNAAELNAGQPAGEDVSTPAA